MSDKAWSRPDAVGPGAMGLRRDRLRLLDTTDAGAREGDLFQAIRDQRSAVPVGDPPERDTPGVIGATGLDGLDDDALLSRLERITTLEAMLAAEKATTLAAVAATVCGVSADLGHDNPRPSDRQARGAERRWHNGLLRSVADETGLALGLQCRAAARRVNASIDMVTRFPTTLRWLSDGRIPERAAMSIAAELGCIQDPATRLRVELKVLNWVAAYGPMRVKRVARREAAKVTAEHDAMSHQARLDERCVELRPVGSGIAELAISCSALDAVAVMNSLSKAAIKLRRDGKGEQRTLDQLRADIAIQRLLGNPTDHPTNHSTTDTDGSAQPREAGATQAHESGATRPRDDEGRHAEGVGAPHDDGRPQTGNTPATDDTSVRTEIVIHCTAAEAEALTSGACTTGGDLDGYGPLPQPALWEAFRTAKLRYRLTDREPVGDPDRYTPSAALARHVIDRDRTCQATGCNQPAIRCDIDHRVEHPDGKTDCGNCAALCRHHHRLKHRGGWNLRRLPTGEHTWTSPTGRRYLTPPPEY